MAILSIFYALGQICQGLLLHPYQTVQSLVREKIFMWMIFLPISILTFVIVFWRQVVLSIVLINLPHFLIYWFIFYCIYWQGLLLYLLVRFLIGFRL